MKSASNFEKIMLRNTRYVPFHTKVQRIAFVFSKVGVSKKRCLSCKKVSANLADFCPKRIFTENTQATISTIKAGKLFSGTASVIFLCIFSVT